MPRASDVYTLPAAYEATAGETILASQHNTPLEDIETDLNAARPIVAGGTGATTAAGAQTNLGLEERLSVASLAALKALTAGKYTTAWMKGRTTAGDGAEGMFVWMSGDRSTNVTADTQAAIWVPPDSDNTGASGAWQRHYDGIVNVKWFGAVGDNSTDDLTAFNAADAYDVNPVRIPAGTYRLSVAPNESVDTYFIVDEGATWNLDTGTWNPHHYLERKPEPFARRVNHSADNPSVANGAYAVLTEAYQAEDYLINEYGYQELDGSNELAGTTYESVGTSLRERTSNVATITTATNHLLRTGNVMTISGMGDASYNASLVTVTVTGATTFTYASVGGDEGSTSDTGGTVSGQFARTMSAQHRWRMAHSGEGDCYHMYATAAATDHGNVATKTGWGGQNSTGFAGVQINAATDDVNLYGIGDLVLSDAGFDDVGLLGHVTFLRRTGANTASYAVPRFGHYIKSTGAQDIDAAFIAAGNMEVGFDATGCTLSTSAAFVMAAGQGVYFAGTPSSTSGQFHTQSVGTYYMRKDASLPYIGVTSNNTELVRVYGDRHEVRGADGAFISRVYGASTTAFLSLGQIGTGSYVLAASSGTDTTNLVFQTAVSGTETTRLTIDTSGHMRPGADDSQDLGTSSLRWQEGFIKDLKPGAGTVKWTSGSGTPEGVVTAAVGSLFTRTDGGASTTLYVKESGAGNTGWVAK